MKNARLLFAASLLFLTAGFSSCIRADYYEPDPEPQGYAYTFDDDFLDNSYNWAFDDNVNSAHVAIFNGQLKYAYYPQSPGTNTVAVSTGVRVNRDWLAQTRFQSNNSMALIFGLGNGEYGYSLFIDDRGYFALYDEGNASTAAQTILEWTTSSAIRSGWNDVELEQVGSNWNAYVNGTRIFSIPARSMFGDQFGYMVLQNTTGFAEYLTVKSY